MVQNIYEVMIVDLQRAGAHNVPDSGDRSQASMVFAQTSLTSFTRVNFSRSGGVSSIVNVVCFMFPWVPNPFLRDSSSAFLVQ